MVTSGYQGQFCGITVPVHYGLLFEWLTVRCESAYLFRISVVSILTYVFDRTLTSRTFLNENNTGGKK